MKSIEDLARLAHAAYTRRAGGHTLDGEPLPQWHELAEIRQRCWIEAARAVADEFKHLH